MNISLVLAFFWALVANVLATIPSKVYYWHNAQILIGIGIPLLGFVTFKKGPSIGLVVLIAAMSMLLWPFVYLSRRIKSRVTGAVK
jgi:hypothetical protein